MICLALDNVLIEREASSEYMMCL